jgi:hypothetical protein
MQPSDAPVPRPKLPESFHQYTSRLDATKGPIRATSDGILVEENTGDYVDLDFPPHNRDLREPAPTTDRSATRAPIVELPEASNGGTGLEDPRKRRSVKQFFKDVWIRFQ